MRYLVLSAVLMCASCASIGDTGPTPSSGDLEGVERGRVGGTVAPGTTGTAGMSGSAPDAGTDQERVPDAMAADTAVVADTMTTVAPDALGLDTNATAQDPSGAVKLEVSPSGTIDLGTAIYNVYGPAVVLRVTNTGTKATDKIMVSTKMISGYGVAWGSPDKTRGVNPEDAALVGCQLLVLEPGKTCGVVLNYFPRSMQDMDGIVTITAGALSVSVRVIGHVLGPDGGM